MSCHMHSLGLDVVQCMDSNSKEILVKTVKVCMPPGSETKRHLICCPMYGLALDIEALDHIHESYICSQILKYSFTARLLQASHLQTLCCCLCAHTFHVCSTRIDQSSTSRFAPYIIWALIYWAVAINQNLNIGHRSGRVYTCTHTYINLHIHIHAACFSF
jgi:hypothetical protein